MFFRLTISDNTSEVFCCEFSADGMFLAAGCGDGAIRVFNAQVRHISFVLPLPHSPLSSIQFISVSLSHTHSVSVSLSHTHTLTLSPSHTHTHTHIFLSLIRMALCHIIYKEGLTWLSLPLLSTSDPQTVCQIIAI